MRPPPWSDAHDRLLADAEPPVPAPSVGELDRVWSRVEREVEHAAGRGRRRTGVRVGVAAGIGAVLLGTSGLAAAELYTARTGEGPVDAEDRRLGGPGERLRMAAPDYAEVLAEETADIPFPSVEARALAMSEQVRDVRDAGDDEFVTTGAVRAWVADQALCSWANQWAAATRSGDETERAEAITTIQSAPTWDAVTAIDPAPYSRVESMRVTDGERTWTERYRDTSQFFYLDALGEAVERREPEAVARLLSEHNGSCGAENTPDLPRIGER